MTYVGDKNTRDKQGNEGETALNNQRYVIIHSYGIKLLWFKWGKMSTFRSCHVDPHFTDLGQCVLMYKFHLDYMYM